MNYCSLFIRAGIVLPTLPLPLSNGILWAKVANAPAKTKSGGIVKGDSSTIKPSEGSTAGAIRGKPGSRSKGKAG